MPQTTPKDFAEITERRHTEAVLRAIVEGTARVTGDEFFHALVCHLARALSVPFALVGAVSPADPTRLHTLAFWSGESFAPEMDYDLATTPCGQVFGQAPRLFDSHVGADFPLAACMLDALGADSYFGYPLTGASGEPLGVLAIMDSRPMAASDERTALMSIFAARAAAELERQRAEAAIRQLNADLEERVKRRTAELTEANRELESFAYSISHDLRAPLRGIDGFSRLLQEEYGDRLDVQGSEYLVRVRRATQRLGTLIDDLLELSRVSRREMRRVRVDLSTLVAEIADDLRRAEPERVVDVHIEPHCATEGDPQLLRVLLENLVGNAWKYSRDNRVARIEFGSETTAGEIRYFVRDNGVGFDMAYVDKLFGPFQRLHNPAEFEGSGIGLASAARVVRRHGGLIWAESRVGEGAVFRFTLGENACGAVAELD